MTPELLNLIIKPFTVKHTCFLCFKQNEELQMTNSELLIFVEDLELTVTVSRIMEYLYPFFEIISNQVCDNCSNVIISMYILIQKHSIKKLNLIKIAQRLDEQALSVEELNGKCYLRCTDDNSVAVVNYIEANLINKEVINEYSLECAKCNMKFESKDHLKEHNKISHKNTDKAIICHICGKTCKTPSALKGHLNCHQEKQCPYCSKLLKMHSHYKIHVKNHVTAIKRERNKTSYKCHNCNFVSFNKSSLEAHMNKAHLGLRPHTCPICLKGFFKKSNLTEHVIIHEKVKNETCEVCGDNFVCKKTLREHLRLHRNEMPYECLICFKKFVTSGRRSDHVKRKHMEKTQCCMYCNKMFSLKKELNRHVKKSHTVSEYVGNVDGTTNIELLIPNN